jgi:LPXTG-motif cell wall-anchored protein
MRTPSRVLAATLAGSLAGVLIAAQPATAASITPGVGSTITKTTVLEVQLGQNGSLLDLNVLGDQGSASIDPTNSPSASASLVPLSLTSGLLHLNLSTPALSTKSPGGTASSNGQSLSLASLGVPTALATGTIKAATLHSDFVTSAAHSLMSAAEVDNLSVLGGSLLSIDLLSSNLAATALTDNANGARGVSVGTVKLLELGALLKGLGIDLASLPVPSVSQLLTTLGTSVPGLPAGVDLSTFVTQLNDSITSLRGTLNAALTQVTGTVNSLTNGILGGLGLPLPSLSSTVTQINDLISQVQAKLIAVLTQGLSALDSAPLVQVSATQVGVATKAADTLAHSAVSITTAPITVSVAGITLPALDATALVGAVNGALSSANTALNGLLGKLGLPANLVSLSLLDQAKSLTMANGYTQAVGGITGLTAQIAAIDPSVVTGAVAKLVGPTVGSLLGSSLAAVALPLTNAMSAVAGLLKTAAPLTGGALVRIASVGSSSTYALAAAPTVTATPGLPGGGPGTLPHTGANSALPAAGVALALLSAATVTWRRRMRGRTTAA